MYDKIVVEYSVSQKAFYYDTIKNIIVRNQQIINDSIVNDYKIIEVCNSIDEAIAFINKYKSDIQLED